MREDQHGQYYGVGMSIQPQTIGNAVRVVVLAPFEGTPSFKAGIRPGDIIQSVDGKSTDGPGLAGRFRHAEGTEGHPCLRHDGA